MHYFISHMFDENKILTILLPILFEIEIMLVKILEWKKYYISKFFFITIMLIL